MVFGFFVAIGIVELVLALVDYTYSPMNVKVPMSEFRFYHIFEDKHFIYDPETIWKGRPNFSVFNFQGFRGPILERPKSPHEYRIFTIGDSNTLGWDPPLNGGTNWPEFLGEILGRWNSCIKVVNAGVWGYISFQGLQSLKKIWPYEPDMVIVSFGANDTLLVYVPDAEFSKRFVSRHNIDFYLNHFRLGQLVLSALDHAWLTPSNRSTVLAALSSVWSMPNNRTMVHRVSLEEYNNNLESIINETREHNATSLLLTRPYTGDVPPGTWKVYAPDYRRATLELAGKLGVPAIDIFELAKNQPQYFGDESHFSEAGHRYAAEKIADFLISDVFANQVEFKDGLSCL